MVGTGGSSHYSVGTNFLLQASNTTTYGVLDLTLGPASYSWRFVPQAGKSYTDSGTTNCG